jgi:sigma-B regulation protein RsbU (phosphoserine phosphatase)
VPAALVLAGVQARFRDEAQRARHAGELLEALNRDLVALEQPEKFMGLLCARVDASSGTLRFANAGLTPPVLRRADGHCEELTESGTLLGVSAGARYDLATVELRPGDLVVVYTDGLTEAARRGQPFGFEGLERVLAAHGHRRAADVLEELLTAVRAWTDEPLDDLTIVVLKQLAVPRGAGEAPKIELKGAAETADANR